MSIRTEIVNLRTALNALKDNQVELMAMLKAAEGLITLHHEQIPRLTALALELDRRLAGLERSGGASPPSAARSDA